MTDLKLKKIQEEYAKINKAINKLQTIVYRSSVINAELELIRSQTKEGDRLNSPFYKVNESLYTISDHLKPIFEKHAGKAAIREAK